MAKLENSIATNINLTPELEKFVAEELQPGNFQSLEEVIGKARLALCEKELSATVESKPSQRESVQEMLAFVQKYHVRLEGVSVKDLIHEGHRL
jgi:hypothetical protein